MRRYFRLCALGLCLFVVAPTVTLLAGCRKAASQPSAAEMPDMMKKGMEMRREKLGIVPPGQSK